MMAARALLSSRLVGLFPAVNFSRRAYNATVAAVALKEPVDAARLAATADQAPKNECFWMRDPKTGCWMPEDHLGDVDAAKLRARLLLSKNV